MSKGSDEPVYVLMVKNTRQQQYKEYIQELLEFSKDLEFEVKYGVSQYKDRIYRMWYNLYKGIAHKSRFRPEDKQALLEAGYTPIGHNPQCHELMDELYNFVEIHGHIPYRNSSDRYEHSLYRRWYLMQRGLRFKGKFSQSDREKLKKIGYGTVNELRFQALLQEITELTGSDEQRV